MDEMVGAMAGGWLLVSNCGTSSKCEGAETCACYGNSTCDDGPGISSMVSRGAFTFYFG